MRRALATPDALRAPGVWLALDDCGPVYSALGYRKPLPVNSVNIARSFVGDLETHNPNAQIVLAIIELAHALGMSVTAAGAETPGQLNTLRAMPSDQAQGYLLGRPMPVSSMGEVLAAQCVVPADLPLPRSRLPHPAARVMTVRNPVARRGL